MGCSPHEPASNKHCLIRYGVYFSCMAMRDKENVSARNSKENTGNLQKRASELALNHGRPADSVTDADVTWAKRELKPMELSSPVPAAHQPRSNR
jgi:hypothetical protein